MIVSNQDLTFTTTEFGTPLIIGGLAGGITEGAAFFPTTAGTDIVTSIASVGYDLGRMTEKIPNILSVGFGPGQEGSSRGLYFLIYPTQEN